MRSFTHFLLGAALLAGGVYSWRRGWLNYEPKPFDAVAQALTQQLKTLPAAQSAPHAVSPQPGSPPEQETPKPAPAKASSWRIHGQVFDLVTLKPVAGARITFTDKNTGKAIELASDQSGGYAVSLAPLAEGGYLVTLSHKRYGHLFLEEGDVPFRQMSRERREETRESLRGTKVVHVPLLLPENQSELEYNLAAARL